MDECDTAALTFECANQKDPDVVFELVANKEIDPSAVRRGVLFGGFEISNAYFI
jgi:hypothetical protein